MMNEKFLEFIKYTTFEKYCEHTPIFHWTHISNIDEILKHNVIYSKNGRERQKIKLSCDISNHDVQNRRENKNIVINNAEFGSIHDYTPFYFSPNNRMFYKIKSDNKEIYNNLVCFITMAQKFSSLEYCFSHINASNNLAIFYNDLNNIKDAINELCFFEKPQVTGGYCQYYDSKTENLNHRFNRGSERQAEFLIKEKVDLKFIDFFIVKNEENFKILLQKNINEDKIAIVKDW